MVPPTVVIRWRPAVAGKVLDIINTPEMLNGVRQRHDAFIERLNTINERFSMFSEIRGLGLLLGCVLQAEFAGKAKLIAQEAAKAGVMVLIAGGDVVRFAPALNVSDEEIATGLDRFALACERLQTGRRIMRVIRPVEHADIAALMQLAGKTGGGLTSLAGK
ncbi:succinylornithine transaminase [Salmonella bongori]|nr:succinylornithine transaminase [Salmonella bongori]